jgi:glycosyltransferase involved in cell wall biosynthesis
MKKIKISVITPSARPSGLPMVEKCLKNQTFKNFEWIVVTPSKFSDLISVKPDKLLTDPPMNRGDFWSLCKGWNKAYAHAEGDLVINIQDYIWFPEDTLQKFWEHYVNCPTGLISAVGHHYSTVDEMGVPVNEIWRDPRYNGDFWLQDVSPGDFEMSMCSIPKRAIYDVGGIDEEYDKGPGVQEKEMCWRMNKLDWDFYIDHTIEYRALEHGRLTDDWDEKYVQVITPLFIRHMKELSSGIRSINVGNILKYVPN